MTFIIGGMIETSSTLHPGHDNCFFNFLLGICINYFSQLRNDQTQTIINWNF